MAMRDLIDADCGMSNPLLKVASHFTQDKGQQAIQPLQGSASDQLVKEFLLETNEAERRAPETFDMGCLLHEMSAIDQFYNQPPEVDTDVSEESVWVHNYLVSTDLSPGSKPINPMDNSWANEYLITSEQDILNQRTQGNKTTEICEIATALTESVTDSEISESKFMRFIKKVGDGEIDLSNLKEASDVEEVAPVPQQPAFDIWGADFVSSWPQMPHEGLSSETRCETMMSLPSSMERTEEPVQGLVERAWDTAVFHKPEMEDEFQTFARSENEKQEEEKSDADFWDNLQKEWEKMAKEETSDYPWLTDYDGYELYKDYTFSKENPFSDHTEPFEEGLRMLKSGDLPSAVLLFEAAVQRNSDHIEAWQYLATSQAKNEQDRSAIAAAKRCLDLDPTNLTAWMSLAVSYTNEGMPTQACETLVKWLFHNPKYTHLVKPEMLNKQNPTLPVSSLLSSSAQQNATQEMFIEAARMSPNQPDPDVQNGLGVLFNLTGDYDKAVDCFKAALQVKPEDSLLWNRLGATLANSNRSGEAFEAYYRALELYPGLIRSRFNLGVSCINLNAVKEAIEHFLLALNLQNAGRGPQGVRSKAAMSSNIWTTLRTAITLLQRPDLYEAVDRKDLDLLNREFGMEM